MQPPAPLWQRLFCMGPGRQSEPEETWTDFNATTLGNDDVPNCSSKQASVEALPSKGALNRDTPSFLRRDQHVYFNDGVLKDVMGAVQVGVEYGWHSMFNYVHKLCPRMLNCDHCTMFLCSMEMDEIITLTEEGVEQRVSCAVESVASVVFDGAVVELNRNSDPEDLATWYAPEEDTDWRMLVFPVHLETSQMLGALRVNIGPETNFSSYDRRAAEALADILAFAVSIVLQAERDGFLREKSEALPVTSRRLLSVMGVRPLFEVVRQELQQLLGFECVHMYLFDRARGDLWTETPKGRVVWPLTEASILNEVFKACAPMMMHADGQIGPAALDKGEWNIVDDTKVVTMAVVPILHPLMANAPFGVLQVCNKVEDRVSFLCSATIKDDDVRVLEAMSLHVASAVHSSQMLQNYTQSHSTEVYANNTSIGQALATVSQPPVIRSRFAVETSNWFQQDSEEEDEEELQEQVSQGNYEIRDTLATRFPHRNSRQSGYSGTTDSRVRTSSYDMSSVYQARRKRLSKRETANFSDLQANDAVQRSTQSSTLDAFGSRGTTRASFQVAGQMRLEAGGFEGQGLGGKALRRKSSVSYYNSPLENFATVAHGAFAGDDVETPSKDNHDIYMDVLAADNFLLGSDILASDILDPDLDLLQYSKEQLENIVLAMFVGLRFDSCLGFPRSLLMTMIHDIQMAYKDNPFHNWAHAVTVTHTTFITIIGIPDIGNYLKLLDIMAVLLAGLAHDMYHTGQNNSFHVQSMSTYAIRYNDKSVLEQHSAAAFFELFIQKHPFKNHVTSSEFMQMRQIILNCILDTDLSSHEVSLNLFTSHLTYPFNRDLLDDRKNICSILLHAADLSNPTRKFSQAFEWASRLGDEFLAQAALERSMGLPVAPFMEHVKEKQSMAKNEIYFIKAFVEPLWTSVSKQFPSVCPRLDTLERNLHVYQRMIDPDEKIEAPIATKDALTSLPLTTEDGGHMRLSLPPQQHRNPIVLFAPTDHRRSTVYGQSEQQTLERWTTFPPTKRLQRQEPHRNTDQ